MQDDKNIGMLARLNRQIRDDVARRRALIRAGRIEQEQDELKARRGQLGPTPERMQRGSIIDIPAPAVESGYAVAGTRARRVQSPIDRYHKRHQIETRQAIAADILRDDYEFGIVGIHDAGKGIGGGGPGSKQDHQLAAAGRYRAAITAIGPRVSAIILPVVIGDEGGGEVTVSALAAKLGRDRQTLFGEFSLGLQLLADHYRLK